MVGSVSSSSPRDAQHAGWVQLLAPDRLLCFFSAAIAVGIELVKSPRVLLLDEPTSAKAFFLFRLRRLAWLGLRGVSAAFLSPRPNARKAQLWSPTLCCRPGQRDGSQPDGDAGAAGAAGPHGALPPEGCVGWQGCAWGAGQCGLCMAEPACCNHCKVRSWTGHSRTGVVMLQLHRAWLPNVPPPRCASPFINPIPSSPPSLTTSCCCTPARPSTLGAGRAWWATLQAMAAPAHSVSGVLGWWSWLSQSWSAHVCRPQLPLPEVCSLWGSMSWRVRGCIANTTTTNIAIHVTACLGADTNPTDYAMSLMKTKGDDLVAAWAAQASQLLWRCCAEAPQRRLGVDRGGACMCSSGAAAF